jgi:hypothetical protein
VSGGFFFVLGQIAASFNDLIGISQNILLLITPFGFQAKILLLVVSVPANFGIRV